MMNVADWADEVEWSGELHFAQTPFRQCGDGFRIDRDCGKNKRCIVPAIANYTERAMLYGAEPEIRAEALRFLIHFVGDIHQPLHLGFEKDLGGNRIRLLYPSQYSLHGAWDEYLVNFDVLKREMKSHGLTVKDSGTFEGLYEKLRSENPASLSAPMREALQMNAQEKRYSFMHRWFIFSAGTD